MRGEGQGEGENMGRLTSLAKTLRKKTTDTESDLWYYLRAKRFERIKFRRQHPIGSYIVDFVCLDRRVIIELDGSQHIGEKEKDNKRDEWLKREGYQVLRFFDNEFYENQEEILEQIYQACFFHPPPLSPSPQGRGE